MEHDGAVDVQFFRLSEGVGRCFTSLYSFTISGSPDVAIEDMLHPESASMRFTQSGTPPIAAIAPEELTPRWPFVFSGPTSRAIRFRLPPARIWGLGMMPIGWAKYAHGPASAVADVIADGSSHDAFARFRPLRDIIRASPDDCDATAARINAFLVSLQPAEVPRRDQILSCQTALLDPDICSVDMLAERVATSRRTLERLCSRYFGFPPKLLLRRQRFLRTLARYMLESRGNWSNALDRQYFDQAHFVHDFRSFMGLSPSEYAAMPHPILDKIMAHRMADQGAAPPIEIPAATVRKLRAAD